MYDPFASGSDFGFDIDGTDLAQRNETPIPVFSLKRDFKVLCNCVLGVYFVHAARERPDSPEQIIEVIAASVAAVSLRL